MGPSATGNNGRPPRDLARSDRMTNRPDFPDAGWILQPQARSALLGRFPPRYANAIAHHVTAKPNPPPGQTPPAAACRIVGRADDGAGVEAMVVEMDGTTDRPDGSTYHITWSLEPGRKARESNDVIREGGWTPLPEAVPIPVTPARFDWRDPA